MYQLRKPNKQIDYIKQTLNCSMFIIINSINEIYFKENRNYKLNKKKNQKTVAVGFEPTTSWTSI